MTASTHRKAAPLKPRPTRIPSPAAVVAMAIALPLQPLPGAAQTLPGPVVNAEWLSAHLDEPGVVVIQVGAREAYDVGHIRGARHLDLARISFSRGERDDPDHVMLDVPAVEVVREALEEVGVSDDSRVVVTFDESRRVTSATRVLWTLEFMGLGGQSALLDGGNPAWVREGHVLTSDAVEAAPGHLSLEPALGHRVDKAWVLANLETPGVALVDGRRVDPYTGAREEFPGRAGHIPGAGNLPIEDLFDADGMLRTRTELTSLLNEAGVAEGDTVVAYCHIGLRATAVILAARAAGFEALLYDGSMSEWGRDSSLPLERGPGNR